MYKVLDLFSGIGMFAYGLEKTGLYETTAFCEWDDKCKDVLRKHWPEVPVFKDITNMVYFHGILHDDIDGSTLFTDIDVITGGFPCQDLSVAKRDAEGLAGKRSGLWKEYKRVISEVKPKGVIIENVSALLNRGLTTILSDLDQIGYDAEWHCITAKHLGAYHQRDRVFILAYSRSKGGEGYRQMEFIPKNIRKVGEQEFGGREMVVSLLKDNPFRGYGSVPQPLLCGMDVRNPGRVDRLKQVGNTVYWPIVEQLGYHMHSNIKRMEF